MKYKALVIETIKGLVLILFSIYVLFEIRELLVYRKAMLPWGVFTTLSLVVIAIVFSYSAKRCMSEIEFIKRKEQESKDNE